MTTVKGIVAALCAAAEKEWGKAESPEVVSWRLSVCETCPMRRKARTAIERASVVLGEHSCSGQVCDVCGCSLALLTSATKEHLHEDNEEEALKRPTECWMNS